MRALAAGVRSILDARITGIEEQLAELTALRGKVSMAVTGRSVGVLLQRGPANGKVAVYLDGRKVAVLNLRANSTSTRIAWASALTTTRSHTVSVVNLSKGKRLGVDGLVVLQ